MGTCLGGNFMKDSLLVSNCSGVEYSGKYVRGAKVQVGIS